MVSIITVNYNGLKDTRNFLASLKQNIDNADYEMIVVDNGSVQNEAIILQDEFEWAKVIRSEENLGFAGGNNIGIDNANGNFLLFINNDIIISSEFLTSLINRLSSDEKIGIVSPKIVYSDNRLCYGGCQPLGKYLIKINYITDNRNPQTNLATETSLAHGAAMITKREVIEKVGKWPENYFLYSEEVDYCLTIKRDGYTIWYEPESIVCHIGSQSTGKDSPLKYYYNTRNRFLLYKRNLKGITKIISTLYELAIAVPQRCINLALSKKYSLLKPVLLGTMDAIANRFGRRRY
jgi:GT2 family glycosyltransferase